jgi:hypothetical protein
MKDISLEYRYTLDEAVRAAVEVTRSVIWFSRVMPWLGAVLLVVCAVSVVAFHKPISDLTATIVFGGIFAAMPLITRWSAKRRARELPSLNNLIKWEINDSELRTSTEGAEARFVWDKIIKVHENRNGFLLFPQPRLAHWIPKRAFQGESDIELFREIVKSKPIIARKSD